MNKAPLFSSKKSTILFIVFSVFAILVMCTIFTLSAENATQSDETSGGIIEIVLNVLYDGYEDISEAEKVEIILSFQPVIRTFAHCFAFLTLGFFIMGAAFQIDRSRVAVKFLFALLLTIAYALFDEIHQLFVPGRALQAFDIAIDSLGAILGALIFLLLQKLFFLFFKNVAKRNRML